MREKVTPFHKNAGLVEGGKVVQIAKDAIQRAQGIAPLTPLTPGNYEKVGNVQMPKMPAMPAMPKVPNGRELASTINKTVQDGLKSAGVGQVPSGVPTGLSGAPRAPRTPRVPRTPRMPRTPRY